MFQGKHILIIVENLSVPFDRRVWQEANTLKDYGAKVSVICPKMKGYTNSYECIDGIEVYRHPLPIEANNAFGFLMEYSIALFWEFILSWKIFLKKRFHVIQGCNPDLIFLVALFFKPFRVKYIFDHHDISPEFYTSKFEKKGFYYRLLILLERLTYATANYSIATNESYKEIAIRRGKMNKDKIQVVRSGPNLERLKLGMGNNKYKKGREYLIGYIGVIGESEGIDLLLESLKFIVSKRKDVQVAIVGGGTSVESLKKLTLDMGLSDYVDFYGRVDDDTMLDVLNTTDVCVNPDKPSEMNNLSTMNKIMEYMALKKPIVQYDMKEGKFSAGDASLYAKNTCTKDFGEKIIWLLDNEMERIIKGEYGYNRIAKELSWEYESQKLISFYKKVWGL